MTVSAELSNGKNADEPHFRSFDHCRGDGQPGVEIARLLLYARPSAPNGEKLFDLLESTHSLCAKLPLAKGRKVYFETLPTCHLFVSLKTPWIRIAVRVAGSRVTSSGLLLLSWSWR